MSLAVVVPFHSASWYCTYTVFVPSAAVHPFDVLNVQLLLVPYVSHALHVLLLQLKRIFQFVIHTHASLALNVNVTVALFVYASLLFIFIVHVLGAVLSIFVTHVPQLHSFHAKSFTYHVCTPFDVTLNVFVLP